MPSYSDLLDKVLTDTLACQDETTPEYISRAKGNYPPLGAFLGGGYPTTDAALDAVCEIADRLRVNDKSIKLICRNGWPAPARRGMPFPTPPAARWTPKLLL